MHCDRNLTGASKDASIEPSRPELAYLYNLAEQTSGLIHNMHLEANDGDIDGKHMEFD